MKRLISVGLGLWLVGAPLGNGWAEDNTKLKQEISVGVQVKNQDKPEALFEKYGEIPRGLVFDQYRLGYTGSTYDLSIDTRWLRLDDQVASFSYWRNDGWKVGGYWRRLPTLTSAIAKSPFTRTQPGQFDLPQIMPETIEKNITVTTTVNSSGVGSTSEALNTTAKEIYSQYGTMAKPVELKIQRDAYGISLERPITDDLDINAGMSYETKQGAQQKAFSFGFSNVVELPEPVDYDTTKANAGAAYHGDKWNVGVDYQYTVFQNKVPTVTWANPKSYTDNTWYSAYSGGMGPRMGRMPLPPNNQSHQVNAVGNIELDPTTRLALNFGYGTVTQNEQLLPYTTNSAIKPGASGLTAQVGGGSLPPDPPFDMSDGANLPRQKAEGAYNTISSRAALTVLPMQDVDLQVQYRSYQLANTSTRFDVPGMVNFDGVYVEEALTAKRYSHHKRNIDGDVNFSLMPEVSFGVNGGVELLDRSEREVEESTELKGRVSLALKPLSEIQFKLAYDMGQRRMADFHIGEYTLDGVMFIRPGARLPDVTDRDVSRVTGGANLQVIPDLQLAVQGHYGTENFLPGKGDLTAGIVSSTMAATQYGLLDVSRYGGTVSLEYPLATDWFLSLFYDYQYIKSRDRSNSAAGLNQATSTDWIGSNTDLYQTAGVNLDTELSAEMRLDLGYSISFATNDVDLKHNTTTYTNPPQNRSLWHQLTTRLECKLTSDLTLIGRYGLEAYEVKDFATDNLPITDSAYTSIYLGDSSKGYIAHTGFLGLGYRW